MMSRLLAFMTSVFLATTAMATDELPKDPDVSFDIEPPLLIQEAPNRRLISSTEAAAPKELDPEQISVALEKAKKSAAAGERAYKSGIIAKVESENRFLKIVKLEADLANARLEVASQTVAAQQIRFEAGEISQTVIDEAKSALAEASSAAQSATANRNRAEFDAAVLNLQRQKKLLALGSGRKSEVNRAQERVATLKEQKD
jgi:hypothetical protein